jgi:CHAD domain-containing protein
LVSAAEEALGRYELWSSVNWPEIADRAVGTYRAARRSWKRASRRRVVDAVFHDWRRRVKRLLYQCEFLGGRARLVRFTGRVDRLGEILGEFQDVCVAEHWLGRLHGLDVPPDLGRSKERLRRLALQRASALLLPKPREFRRMLG